MRERLSWEEIKRRYPDEWVILTDATWDDESHECIDAFVYLHSKDKDDLIGRHDPDAKHERAIWFTGTLRHWRLAV